MFTLDFFKLHSIDISCPEILRKKLSSHDVERANGEARIAVNVVDGGVGVNDEECEGGSDDDVRNGDCQVA